MNRYQMEAMRAGIAKELETANKRLSDMYIDTSTTLEDRGVQKSLVKDIKERLEGVNEQIKAADEEAAQRMGAGAASTSNKEEQLTAAKADFYRHAVTDKSMEREKAALLDTGVSGGGKILPKNMANELLTTHAVKNPLRELSTFTQITNLEVPKLTFTLDDDEFISDGETAKEMASAPDSIEFGRNKFKVMAPVSETILKGVDANLVQTIETALQSGLAKKEKKLAFDKKPSEVNKHMSFYSQTTTDGVAAYDIKAIEEDSVYSAIVGAIADLEEDYRDNAAIVMRFSDYISIVEKLSNGNSSLYSAPPEQVFGKPVKFCDLAAIPVVGDFSYSHYNYDLQMGYDRDKDVKTGIELFVLTAWIDHQIKMRAAFRLAIVKGAESV